MAKRVVTQRDCVSPCGVVYDRFEPVCSWQKEVIAVHGVTLNGKNDPRLQHFAKALAASGTACIVPTLNGLSSFQWQYSDIEELSALALEVSTPEKELGLVGFSYGGSYALVAATTDFLADKVSFVMAFGAYHSLADLHKSYASQQISWPEKEKELDSWIYLQLLLAFKNAQRLSLPNEVVEEMKSLLHRYCHESSAKEKKKFAKRHLEKLDVVGLELELQDNDELERLTPAGKIAGLKCRISLLHDPTDGVVPYLHLCQLAKELQEAGCDHKIMVTRLLNHAALSDFLKFGKWWQLATILLPLVAILNNSDSDINNLEFKT